MDCLPGHFLTIKKKRKKKEEIPICLNSCWIFLSFLSAGIPNFNRRKEGCLSRPEWTGENGTWQGEWGWGFAGGYMRGTRTGKLGKSRTSVQLFILIYIHSPRVSTLWLQCPSVFWGPTGPVSKAQPMLVLLALCFTHIPFSFCLFITLLVWCLFAYGSGLKVSHSVDTKTKIIKWIKQKTKEEKTLSEEEKGFLLTCVFPVSSPCLGLFLKIGQGHT